MDNLALGTLEACRDVFDIEIPHFFRDVRTEKEDSVEPELFHVSGLDSDDPRCSVHIIGCTGDWFGGWDGLVPGDADRFITKDLEEGRMVEVIDSGQPAIMVCHWPGLYYNGTRLGFNIFKTVVKRLHEKYDHLVWKKNSDIARYWACRKLTLLRMDKNSILMKAPFGTPEFTIRIDRRIKKAVFTNAGQALPLSMVKAENALYSNSFFSNQKESIICFDLPKGESKIELN
jgi:hypothetical protein